MSDKPYFHEHDSKSIETRVHMLKLPDGRIRLLVQGLLATGLRLEGADPEKIKDLKKQIQDSVDQAIDRGQALRRVQA
jgi:hypothetical protein